MALQDYSIGKPLINALRPVDHTITLRDRLGLKAYSNCYTTPGPSLASYRLSESGAVS